jgi:hypothetical protein
MTTIELWNLALYKLGVTKGVVALDESSLESILGAAHYDHILRAVLRRFSWPFATKYANPLTLVGGRLWDADSAELTDVQAWSASVAYPVGYVVRVGGVNYSAIAASTNQTPPNTTYWIPSTTPYTDAVFEDYPAQFNPDHLYAYRWPTDCLYMRRLVNAAIGRGYDTSPYPWRVNRDASGLLLVTNQPDAVLEYTAIDCDNLWVDDLFIDAFTWRLAEAACSSVVKNGLTTEKCHVFYEDAFAEAATKAANEQQQEPEGDASWIQGR